MLPMVGLKDVVLKICVKLVRGSDNYCDTKATTDMYDNDRDQLKYINLFLTVLTKNLYKIYINVKVGKITCFCFNYN